MSFNVLVIPEDIKDDEAMLKPLIEALVRDAGKPQAQIRVCKDPVLGGFNNATPDTITEIVERYCGNVQLFLLCVDRDGEAGRQDRLRQLCDIARPLLPTSRTFFAVQAWQEIEVWVLAGCTDFRPPAGESFADVRQERDPKERYYEPFARQRGVIGNLAEGRGDLAREAAANFSRVRQFCEEVKDFQADIAAWIAAQA